MNTLFTRCGVQRTGRPLKILKKFLTIFKFLNIFPGCINFQIQSKYPNIRLYPSEIIIRAEGFSFIVFLNSILFTRRTIIFVESHKEEYIFTLFNSF